MENKQVERNSLRFKTSQEKFWFGDFGDEYTYRNKNNFKLACNIALFSRILSQTQAIESAIEFGANIGLNLQAIQQLIPEIQLSAIEINSVAAEELNKLKNITIYHQSILEFESKEIYDFVLVKGVLIHLNPDYLSSVYDLLYKSTKKYICIAEYYNPTPMSINYRGHEEKLFKRDFAGEIMDKFKDLKIVDYGFVYHRDPHFPQDDLNWFLLQK
jgi:spore coat polysaccharide biosynthesis protein SpsF